MSTTTPSSFNKSASRVKTKSSISLTSTDNSLENETGELGKLKEGLGSVYTYIYNEIEINDQTKQDKPQKCKEQILLKCGEFPAYIIEASMSLNYTLNTSNIFASMLFYFLCFDDKNVLVVNCIRNYLLRQYCADGNQEKVALVDNKATQFAQFNKSMNLLSSFLTLYAEAIGDLINHLIKGRPLNMINKLTPY